MGAQVLVYSPERRKLNKLINILILKPVSSVHQMPQIIKEEEVTYK